MKLKVKILLALLGLMTLVLLRATYSLPNSYSFSQVILDAQGAPLRLTLAQDDQFRLWTPLEKIAPELIQMVLLKEDRYFYWHPGVNLASLLRAALLLTFKGQRVGGSTITMQVSKLHFGLYTKNIGGKLKQMLGALFLELSMSKKQILEAYLNLAPYGRNIQGIGAASLVYFHKLPAALAPSESLILSVLPQSPRLLKHHRAKGQMKLSPSMRRQFRRWLATLKNAWAYETALQLLPPVHALEELPFLAPHFVDELLQFGPKHVAILESTLELKLQQMLEKTISSYIERNQHRGIKNAVAMIVDYTTMEAKAVAGSADFFNQGIHGQVNGTRAKRSPGSTLKPFVYALAMEQGLIHNQSLLLDAPLKIQTPENFDKRFLGPLSAEEALILSRNVPAVDLAWRLQGKTLYDLLKMAGVGSLKSESHYGLSLVLGGAEMTMEELLKLYAMLANNGMISPIRKLKGQTEVPAKRLLSREAAIMVKDILKKNPPPQEEIGRHFVKNAVPVYWKTGTSWGFRDAWSVGLIGPYVMAVWIGNFDGHAHPSFVGAEAAAPLFFELTGQLAPHLYKNTELAHSFSPLITEVDVCALSGEIPGEFCPHRKRTLFVPGLSPIEKCLLHREVAIEKKSGLRACLASKGSLEKRVYEFWPTPILELFKKNGLERRVPPAYSKQCLMNQRDFLGHPPLVLAPVVGQVYHQRVQGADNYLALEAEADSDTKELFWYMDGQLIAKVHPGKTYFWQMRPGQHEVQVVDDLGRASSREFRVVLIQ